MELKCDVVVVGAGNAGLTAALAARESGASVIVLEIAPEAERGGNSRFAGGTMRFAFDSVDDLRRLMPELTDEEVANTDFGTYTADNYFDDMGRVTQYRTDPDLCEALVRRSQDTLLWLRNFGVRFLPLYGRQAFKVDGRFKFWGGLIVEAWGGGAGLNDTLNKAAVSRGIRIEYETRAVRLIEDGGRITGIRVRRDQRDSTISCRSVVLATGGYSSNLEWRSRYLGRNWDLVKVRGTRFNMGTGIQMALDIGAEAAGNWTTCHAAGWDRNAPEYGDLSVGDGFQKHSYPFGIMINAEGRRFVDEGADFRTYTYGKYGRVVLDQTGQFAWQIFDAKVLHLLRDEYRIKRVTKASAKSLEELAGKLDDVAPQAFLAEVRAYNAAIRTDVPFNPAIKDGRCTQGLAVNKSNWANTIDTPPFEAYAITCGITFTFGGLRIDTQGRVRSTDGNPIPGLYGAGELLGGLFYFNYPAGSGLTSSAVFGRIAGTSAARAHNS